MCFFRIKQSTGTKAKTSTTNKSNSHINFIIYVERCENNLQRDNHLARLAYIREAHKIIRQSEWQFDAVDSLIGFGRSQ